MSLVAEGPLIKVSGRVGLEPGQHLGHGVHHLVGADHAHVQVGHQADRPPALVG